MPQESETVRIELDPGDPIVQAYKLEAELGVPNGYFKGLLNDDDWSFVIKLHALIEAAVTHALVTELNRPELSGYLARLELADTNRGKLALGKSLACLTEADRRFIRVLAEIRNAFVHDVRNVGASLSDYVAALDKNKLRNVIAAMGPGNDPVRLGDREVSEAEFVRSNPKLSIWMASVYVLAMISLRGEHNRLKGEMDAHRRRVGEEVLARPHWWLLLPPAVRPPPSSSD